MNKEKEEERIKKLILRTAENIGIKISELELPEITIGGEEPFYDVLGNKAGIPESDIYSGRVIGEYVGHILRAIANERRIREYQRINFSSRLLKYLGFKPEITPTKPEKRDIEVDEFFGYLGRKLLENVATSEDNLDFNQRTKYKLKQQHSSYKYAKSLDSNKINLEELYLMSNQEVRHRFFRQDPQYDLSQEPKPAEITRRNSKSLEQRIGLIVLLPAVIILTLFLIAKNITGYVVSSNAQQTSWLSIIILTIMIILIYINFSKSKSL